MESIFGDQKGKFIVGETTVLLDHMRLKPNWLKAEVIIHESIINGTRHIGYIYDKSEFEAHVLLCNYPGTTGKDKFNEVKAFESSLVQFFPHIDAPALKDFENNDLYFYLVAVIPFSLYGETLFDVMKCVFKNQKASKLTVQAVYLKSDPDSEILLSEDGQKLEAN